MQQDHKTGRITVLLEELAYANLVLAEALSELLCEKGVITAAEVKERVRKLRKETKLNFPPLQWRYLISDGCLFLRP